MRGTTPQVSSDQQNKSAPLERSVFASWNAPKRNPNNTWSLPMRSTNRLLQDGTVSQAYADAEGITLIPEFKPELYCPPYVRKHWNPLFPDKGVTISNDLGLNDPQLSLESWFRIIEEKAYLDYTYVRVETEDEEFCDRELKLLMGVLHMDPGHVAMAFKRLNGKAASDNKYSRQSLLLVGAAMWNPLWCPLPYKRNQECYSWRTYVNQQNKYAQIRRKNESLRQAAVADFLGDED